MHTVKGQPARDRASQALKVLVVDDDREDVDYLRRLLVRAGCQHEVYEANTVEQGLEQLTRQPDVVLLDYFLGTHTGMDFLARLDPTLRHPPIILLTGADDNEVDHSAFAGVLADYLPKRNIDSGVLTRSLYYAHRDATRVQQLEYLAHYDPLTGLCNRRLFMDRLEHAYQAVKRQQSTGALLYIDIDGFKQINDDLGHDVGDELLKRVAERMSAVVRSADTVARLGGDEFVILLEHISIAEAHWVAQKLLATMDEPIVLRTRSIQCSLSIGLCAFSRESPSPHHILVNADRALYQAKMIGKHTYCSFNKRLMDSLAQQQKLEAIVHEIVHNGNFELRYQPRTPVASSQWQSVGLEVRFGGLADTGFMQDDILQLIAALGWVELFQRAVIGKWLQEWRHADKRLSQCPVAIRLPNNIENLAGFCQWLLMELRGQGVGTEQLRVELDEALWLAADADARAALAALRDAGCGIALVEFGLEVGSLLCLANAPVTTLSLSPALPDRCGGIAKGGSMISALVQMARSMGIQVQMPVATHGASDIATLSQLAVNVDLIRHEAEFALADLQREVSGLAV